MSKISTNFFFDLNQIDDAFMTKMIHKLHLNIQRLISIKFSIKNIYKLSKQCQRMYESDIQIDKSERNVNKIDQQKQRQIAF